MGGCFVWVYAGGAAMAQEFSKKFYNSKAWKKCRQSYINNRVLIDGGMCEVCHKNLGYILHHKIALTALNINDPDITLNHCNLMYECKDCHDLEEDHFYDSKNISKLNCMFDDSGQPIDTRKI